MKCSSLEEVRENIDRIDDSIIRLIAERAEYVRQAALFKKDEDGVKAPDRVKAVLQKVREKAEKYGAPADIAETVYRNMIAGFIGMELDNFKNDKR
ncbi:chorismate mutase [Ruminococcus flavefaciens]|uniref:Isochorismate pyruvate lyase n=1 Tax=Ruminococcus flavefaciens TaxID=1265 RepID=A0A1M7JTQ1_RUMFL|nr:chorismate mutase [Ruminococcus flavefaciens]SHM56439.1 isochorismate pyruvate lyase [Ruminococcus flavefaciens]